MISQAQYQESVAAIKACLVDLDLMKTSGKKVATEAHLQLDGRFKEFGLVPVKFRDGAGIAPSVELDDTATEAGLTYKSFKPQCQKFRWDAEARVLLVTAEDASYGFSLRF